MKISTSSEVICLNRPKQFKQVSLLQAICEPRTSTNHNGNIQLQYSFPLTLIHAIYIFFQINPKGGAVASWLVRSTPLRSSFPGSSPGWGHCVVFWSQHFTVTLPLFFHLFTSISSRGKILPVALCYRKRHKPWPNGPLGSYVDSPFLL